MSRLRPFAYPATPHRRKHGPGGYERYQEYKDWLRDEFTFRCVYCLARETWYPNGQAAFSVEHVLPRSAYPHLECVYDNLVYACARCNSHKRQQTTLDPTATALAVHVRAERDGRVTALTREGEEYVRLLDLNDPVIVRVRLGKRLILRLKRAFPDDGRIERLYAESFGFPHDLPDLDAKRPEANSRPQGLRNSYFRRRAQGRLAEVY